jgi:hypothetical protein
MRRPHVLIVGGGASGILLAVHLLRLPGELQVSVVEKRDRLGRGVAYSTRDASHLLNTRVANMSAFPDDPEHFLRWLRQTGEAVPRGAPSPFRFVRREVYGRYLSELLTPWRAIGGDGRFHRFAAECVQLDAGPTGVAATLEDGTAVTAQAAVLATGHAAPVDPAGALADPWTGPPPDPEVPVLLVGAGLTMVDKALSLLDAGHRGQITTVSRRGLLPQPHADSAPLRLDPADLPLGAGVVWTTRWLRRLVREVERRGGDWRDFVDGVRPHVQALWAAFPDEAKRRFLRHARARGKSTGTGCRPSPPGAWRRPSQPGRCASRRAASWTPGARTAACVSACGRLGARSASPRSGRPMTAGASCAIPRPMRTGSCAACWTAAWRGSIPCGSDSTSTATAGCGPGRALPPGGSTPSVPSRARQSGRSPRCPTSGCRLRPSPRGSGRISRPERRPPGGCHGGPISIRATSDSTTRSPSSA